MWRIYAVDRIIFGFSECLNREGYPRSFSHLKLKVQHLPIGVLCEITCIFC